MSIKTAETGPRWHASIAFVRRRAPVTVWLAGAVLMLVALVAVCGHLLAPFDPNSQNLYATLQAPSRSHWLGTDDLGRDVLSRVVVGTTPAIVGPLLVAAACCLIGGTLGLWAGLAGGAADTIVSRLVDVMYALPALLVAIVLVGVTRGGYWLTAGVLILLSFPYQTRLCRSATLSQRSMPYVDAARTMGVKTYRIAIRHVLPNIVPTMLTAFLLDFTGTLIAYSSLDYLGLGSSPGSTVVWGGMISNGQAYISANPWVSLAPAAAILAVASSATLFGDWVYDSLTQRGEPEEGD